jgi:RNase P/RNase MRP subunit POP5
MLKVKASAKVHRRYFLILGSRASVEKAILDYIGILGWAKAAPQFVSRVNSTREGKIVLAVDRAAVDLVRAAFAVDAGNVRVLKVSGTLKGLGVR